jgi:hypothetical protein
MGHMGRERETEEKYMQGFWRGNLNKRNCLENLSMDERIKLKSI